MITWRLPLIVLTCLSMAVTGCMQRSSGQGTDGIFSHSAASKMAVTGAKTKLKFWSTGRHDANYIKEVIHRYNQENPDNIEVYGKQRSNPPLTARDVGPDAWIK